MHLGWHIYSVRTGNARVWQTEHAQLLFPVVWACSEETLWVTWPVHLVFGTIWWEMLKIVCIPSHSILSLHLHYKIKRKCVIRSCLIKWWSYIIEVKYVDILLRFLSIQDDCVSFLICLVYFCIHCHFKFVLGSKTVICSLHFMLNLKLESWTYVREFCNFCQTFLFKFTTLACRFVFAY